MFSLVADSLAMLADELAAMPGTSMTGTSVSVPVPKAAEMVKAMREAASALRSSGEAVAWPDRMVNMPCPDGSTDRILGFRIPEGDPILGESGLSEPLAWLRSVTIDRCPATPASAWRPIAELDHRDMRTVLYCDARGNRWTQTADCRVQVCGYPATHFAELPTPPTPEAQGHE